MSYFRPTDLKEAVAWLAENKAQVAAGCTDLFAATSGPALSSSTLDVTAIQGLRGIDDDDHHWRIGGATNWTDILRTDLPAAFDGLKAAASKIGSVQIQNAGTIAGNLCNASPAADGVPPLLILEAEVELTSAAGSRTLALGDFILGPRQTALAANEIMTAVLIPKAAGMGNSTFVKLGARKHLVISIAMVAARLVTDAGKITLAAIAVGSCGPVASHLSTVEGFLLGKEAKPTVAEKITDAQVALHLSPIDDVRADRDYRLSAAAELVRRALGELLAAGPEAKS